MHFRYVLLECFHSPRAKDCCDRPSYRPKIILISPAESPSVYENLAWASTSNKREDRACAMSDIRLPTLFPLWATANIRGPLLPRVASICLLHELLSLGYGYFLSFFRIKAVNLIKTTQIVKILLEVWFVSRAVATRTLTVNHLSSSTVNRATIRTLYVSFRASPALTPLLGLWWG